MHRVSLSLLALCLTIVVVPAMAQEHIVYENGPVNGQVNARLINFGNAVTDSLRNDNGLLITSRITFWAWLIFGDSITQLEVSIGSAPYGTDLYLSLIHI